MTRSQIAEKQARKRREFVILLALLIPVGCGFFFLGGSHGPVVALQKPEASILSQQVQQGSLAGLNGSPNRVLPARYQIKGNVDDQYTLATDPQTGETLIHDSLGGLGTNTTSIDGDRARLAQDMVDLEKYATANKGQLSPETYNWLKKVARTGMQLAFGTPGLPAGAQPALKKDLLAEFHNISADPTKSFEHTEKFLSLEQVFSKPEEAYLADGGSLDKTNFLKTDPISPALNTFDPAIASISLSANLAGYTLEPSMASLASGSIYSYADTTLSSTEAVATSPTTGTSGTALVSSGPTLAEYYDSTLGTQTNNSVPTATANTSPATSNTTTSNPNTSSSSPTLGINLGNVANLSVNVAPTGIKASAEILSGEEKDP